jgi:DNA repair exonuclease SbcCD ATPase subunit
MRLDLISIEMERFKSFSDKLSINFQKRGEGLHFLRGRNEDEPRLGSNGAGKSSLWDAITWCLYGKTVDGLRGPDVIPWKGKGSTFVCVTIRIDDRECSVTRQGNPNSLLINGKDVGQDEIEHMLGLSFDTFTATILLGQGQPLFFDMTAGAKMDLFSAALDLERWDKRSKAAGNRASGLQADLSKAEGELAGLDRQEEELSGMLDKAKERLANWDEEQAKRLSALDVDLEGMEKELSKLEAIVGEAEVQNDGTSTEWRGILNERRELQYKKEGLARKFVAVEKAVKAHKSGECPTCGQPVGKKAFSHLADAAAEIKELQAQLAKIDKQDKALAKAEAEHEAKWKAAQTILQMQSPRYNELRAQIKAAKDAQAEKQEEQNPHREQVQDLRRRLKRLDVSRRELRDEIADLNESFERTKYWIKGFKDVRLHVIEEVLQELELTTNSMLDEMGLLDWEVKYDIEKETKSGSIKHGLSVSILSPRSAKPVRWESWSGGEGQRLRIIGALALSDVLLNNAGIGTGFEILDEPTRHLSAEGVRDLCDYLSERAHSLRRQIWLVDHQAIESARFSSSLTIAKDKDGSYLG